MTVTITLQVFRREPEHIAIRDTLSLNTIDELALPKTFASDVEGVVKEALASIKKLAKGS